jgi:hypothetical protein
VRVRPLNKKEINNGSKNVVDVDRINASIAIKNPGSRLERNKYKSFTYDAVFPP